MSAIDAEQLESSQSELPGRVAVMAWEARSLAEPWAWDKAWDEDEDEDEDTDAYAYAYEDEANAVKLKQLSTRATVDLQPKLKPNSNY